MKEIVIDISNEGEIQIETRGFKGKSCITEARFLKDVLGKETAKTLTPTYWQEDNVTVKKHLPLCG
ncbi:MAG: hypothetical protein CVU57_23400 [Deltaproteobacteria bacterium HGW-Deltaproteobacteria-15]|jgi:hypothetical protein|nr:MAG: hypothetical protein CVU57_23400 [Deltaproteobacteria bacterium HGW-Deltaproteobacteria-15]